MENEIEKAKALIEQEKQERAIEFNKELQLLCEKYKCNLTTNINIVAS